MPSNALHEAFYAVTPPLSSAEINTLISDHPDSLLEKDALGLTPPFVALKNPAPLEIVQLLMDACPDAILKCDGTGRLPLQWLLQYKAVAKAKALIKANPASLQLREARDGFPLHVAVQRCIDVETCNVVLEGFPEACKMMDGNGLVPLECALRQELITRVNVKVIEALVRAFPKALKIRSTHGVFLMHSIRARYLLTETFFSTVQHTCPGAFLVADNSGRVPLHRMVHDLELDDEAQQAATLAMIRACPEAANVATDSGQLPLHYSMGHLNSRSVKALVEVYPEAVVTKAGDMGQTPLHLLIQNQETFSLEVAKVLVAARPDALVVKDNDLGDIPLAIAVDCDTDLPTVEWLINARPASIEVTNDSGEIPLHIAVCDESAASLELVRMLYQAWPDSPKQADSDGALPLSHAVIYGSQETVTFLHGVYPEATRAKHNGGMLPLHRMRLVDLTDLKRYLNSF